MYSLHNVHLTLVLYVQSAQCTSNIIHMYVCTVCKMYIQHYSCMYSLHNVHLTLVLYVQSMHNVHLTLVLYVQSVHLTLVLYVHAQCTSSISPVCTVCTMYI